MKKQGFDRVTRILRRLPDETAVALEDVNRENGEDIMALARVLIPERSGASRMAIKGHDMPDGGYLLDFGKKAKVIEGDRGPRPFVNPALKATDKRRKARTRKALRDAVKKAQGNG